MIIVFFDYAYLKAVFSLSYPSHHDLLCDNPCIFYKRKNTLCQLISEISLLFDLLDVDFQQFSLWAGKTVIISNQPYFYKKAEIFPGSAFVIGADTAARLINVCSSLH